MKLNARSILDHLKPEQIRHLQAFSTLLRDRAVPLGLIAESDVDRIWDRHVLDSLRGLACMGSDEGSATDLGSGAGLPGIPLAIALPATTFTLLEPKRRRAAFLESVTQELALANVVVSPLRAQQAPPGADLCLARAFASPEESWRAGSRLLGPRGRLIYWAGRSWSEQEEEHLERLGRAQAFAEICSKPEFQWQGPLVIMTRSSKPSPRDDEPTRRSVRREAEGPSAQH